jgi:hypothetical protein
VPVGGEDQHNRSRFAEREDAGSYTQGYNTQAAVNEQQIVLAAEVTASSPDFGHLQPMVEATSQELEAIGVTETPRGRVG